MLWQQKVINTLAHFRVWLCQVRPTSLDPELNCPNQRGESLSGDRPASLLFPRQATPLNECSTTLRRGSALLSCPGCPCTSVQSCPLPYTVSLNVPSLWIHLNFQTCPQPHGGLQHEELPLSKNDICFSQISPKWKRNPIYVWYYARASQVQPQISFQGFLMSIWAIHTKSFIQWDLCLLTSAVT